MKKLLVVFFVFLISGCTVDYQLTVFSDKQFREEIIIKIDRGIYPDDIGTARRAIEDEIKQYKFIPEYHIYDYNYQMGNDYIVITIIGNHGDFNSFRNSPFVKKVFTGVETFEDEFYQLRTYGDIYSVNRGVEPDSAYYINDLEVSLRFHNQVVSTNADEENFRNNVFNWQLLDRQQIEPIEIDLDYNKRYDIIILDFLMANLLIIIIATIIIISGLIVSLLYLRNYKLRNRV